MTPSPMSRVMDVDCGQNRSSWHDQDGQRSLPAPSDPSRTGPKGTAPGLSRNTAHGQVSHGRAHGKRPSARQQAPWSGACWSRAVERWWEVACAHDPFWLAGRAPVRRAIDLLCSLPDARLQSTHPQSRFRNGPRKIPRPGSRPEVVATVAVGLMPFGSACPVGV